MSNRQKLEERIGTITTLMNLMQAEIKSMKNIIELSAQDTKTKNQLLSAGPPSNPDNPDEDACVVYTSAGITSGPDGPQVGLGVWFGDNHPNNISAPCIGKQTQPTGAIHACLEACLVAKSQEIQKLKIITDFDYVPKCMTSFIHVWKQNGWKKKDGTDVGNKIDLMLLDLWSQQVETVTYAVVNEGKGIEAAKALAAKGAKMKAAA